MDSIVIDAAIFGLLLVWFLMDRFNIYFRRDRDA